MQAVTGGEQPLSHRLALIMAPQASGGMANWNVPPGSGAEEQATWKAE